MSKEMTVKELAAMGGRARAEALTKKRRKEIATEAAKKRWANPPGKTPTKKKIKPSLLGNLDPLVTNQLGRGASGYGTRPIARAAAS